MAILNTVKTSLGISNNKHDTDILLAIEAAKQDMKMRGVKIIIDGDPRTDHAIILYCRSWYNFQGDGERYEKAYGLSADAMAQDIDYTMEAGEEYEF